MKRQHGYTLIEVSLALATAAVITAATLAGVRSLNQRAEVRELASQILQLQEIVNTQASSGGAVDIATLANTGQIPAAWLRGAPGAYTVLNASNGDFVTAPGNQQLAPNGRMFFIGANGVRPEVCVAVVALVHGAFDEVFRDVGAARTYIKRAHTSSDVAYSVAGAEAACNVAGSRLVVGWRRS